MATAPKGVAAPAPPPVSRRISSQPTSGCTDPVLDRAFADLTSCNFKGGVIDYQCPAWKKLQKTLGARERESRALVQLSLMRLLGDSDERIRLSAAKSLSGYALQRSVSRRLIAAYRREKNAYVRSWIIHSLHSPGPEAVKLVLQALSSDPDAVVRARAANRLSIGHFSRSPGVAEALTRALEKDKSVEVRKRAAESLGTLARVVATAVRPGAAGPASRTGALARLKATERLLVKCLPDPEIGPHCAIGLSRMQSRAGYDSLLEILRKGLLRHVVRPLFVWTIMSFSGLPFFKAVQVRMLLQRIAADPKMVAGARHYAVKSLSQLGRRVASQRAAVLQFLQGLVGDKVLGVSVKPALARLKRPTR